MPSSSDTNAVDPKSAAVAVEPITLDNMKKWKTAMNASILTAIKLFESQCLQSVSRVDLAKDQKTGLTSDVSSTVQVNV